MSLPPTRQNLMARLSSQNAALTPQQRELGAQIAIGDNARLSGQGKTALDAYQQALTMAVQSGSLHGQEMIQGLIGELLTEQGQYEEAETALRAAIALADQIGERPRQARALGNLGVHYLKRELAARAQAQLERALEFAPPPPIIVPGSPEARVRMLTLANLGAVYLQQANTSYALRLLQEAYTLSQVPLPTNLSELSYVTGVYGQAHLASGDTDRGYKLLAQAARLANQVADPSLELMWENTLAEALFDRHVYAESLRHYDRAAELIAKGATPPPAYARHHAINLAQIYQANNQPAKAQTYSDKALSQAHEGVDRLAEARALTTSGEIAQASGQFDTGIANLQQAITLYEARLNLAPGQTTIPDGLANDPAVDPYIDALLTLGELQQAKGDPAGEMASFDRALALSDSAPERDRTTRARVLRRIGVALNVQGDTNGALSRWNEAIDLFERGGQPAAAARLLCDSASLRRQIAGLNAALPDYERATVLLNTLNDIATRGLVLANVATLYTDLGEIETASAFFQESLSIARQINDRKAESIRMGNYGWFYVATGQLANAVRTLEDALTISRTLNDPLLVAVQSNNLAQAYFGQKAYTAAKTALDQALSLIDTDPKQNRWRAIFQANLGRWLASQGQTSEAATVYDRALTASRAIGDQENVARILSRQAALAVDQKNWAQADSWTQEAEKIARKWGYRKGQADALAIRAQALRAQGDSTGADQALNDAIRLYTILHDPLASELSAARPPASAAPAPG